MKLLQGKLTFANVVSVIALFVALGGASYAATQLPKNSVGAKQLKKNAVTASKIKDGAITGGKIKLGSLGTVPHATSADHATRADTAGSANTAGSAASAASADAVNGAHFATIRFQSGENSAPTVVFSAVGLTLTAQCVSHEVSFFATTSTPAEIDASGNFSGTYKGKTNGELLPGTIFDIAGEIGDKSGDAVQGQLVYRTAAGAVATAQFELGDDSVLAPGGQVEGCVVHGTAQYSG